VPPVCQPPRILLKTFFQDTWRAASNLTLNFGLRYEYEGGIKEAQDRWLTEFDPNARLAITDLAQAAYARNPIPQVRIGAFCPIDTCVGMPSISAARPSPTLLAGKTAVVSAARE
jgi:hypothetical protein